MFNMGLFQTSWKSTGAFLFHSPLHQVLAAAAPSPAPGTPGCCGAALAEHPSLLCHGLLCTRSIRRAETAKAGRGGEGGKASGHHLSSQKQHRCPPFLPPPAQSPGSSSVRLPSDISLALGATKSSAAPWPPLSSPCAVTAWTSLAMPRCPGLRTVPRAHVQAWHDSSIRSLRQDQGSGASRVRGQMRASPKDGNPGCRAHPWGPAHLQTVTLTPAGPRAKDLTELLSQPSY